MRLITRKIYRAFPELDRFSDEQCERFLQAANASVFRWMCRGAVSFGFAIVAGLVTLGGAMYAAAELADHWRLDGFPYWLLFGVLTATALVIAFIPGLILADALLRLRVRSLLKRCGACPQCRYSLLGIRVGADLIVTCPECERKITVDPALGELAIDESGAAVYKPEIVREDAESIARRRRKRRRIIKWSAISMGSIVTLLAAGYGAFWGFLSWQAGTARAARTSDAQIHALSGRGGSPSAESEAEWREYVAIIGAPMEVGTVVVERRDPGASSFWGIHPAALRKNMTAAQYSKMMQRGPEALAEARELAGEVLRECRTRGAFDRLRGLSALKDPRRPVSIPTDRPVVMAMGYEVLTSVHYVGRINLGRMIVAVESGELDEYLSAAEQVLIAARITERQGTLSDRMTATSVRHGLIESIVADIPEYPSAAWFDAVGELLRRYDGRLPMATTLEITRAVSEDYLHYFFGRPAQVRNALLGLPDVDEYGIGSFVSARDKYTIGTHGANVRAMNAAYDHWLAQAKKPSAEWSAVTPPLSGYTLVDRSTRFIGQFMVREVATEFEYRRLIVTLAVEKFRRENGRLPTPAEMSGLGVPPESLVDSVSGRPFRVLVRKGAAAPVQEFVIVSGKEDPESDQQDNDAGE